MWNCTDFKRCEISFITVRTAVAAKCKQQKLCQHAVDIGVTKKFDSQQGNCGASGLFPWEVI